MNGRKRHILVDTLGLLMAVIVTSAALSDPAGAKLWLIRAFDEARLLERINDPLFVHRKIIVLW